MSKSFIIFGHPRAGTKLLTALISIVKRSTHLNAGEIFSPPAIHDRQDFLTNMLGNDIVDSLKTAVIANDEISIRTKLCQFPNQYWPDLVNAIKVPFVSSIHMVNMLDDPRIFEYFLTNTSHSIVYIQRKDIIARYASLQHAIKLNFFADKAAGEIAMSPESFDLDLVQFENSVDLFFKREEMFKQIVTEKNVDVLKLEYETFALGKTKQEMINSIATSLLDSGLCTPDEYENIWSAETKQIVDNLQEKNHNVPTVKLVTNYNDAKQILDNIQSKYNTFYN